MFLQKFRGKMKTKKGNAGINGVLEWVIYIAIIIAGGWAIYRIVAGVS